MLHMDISCIHFVGSSKQPLHALLIGPLNPPLVYQIKHCIILWCNLTKGMQAWLAYKQDDLQSFV